MNTIDFNKNDFPLTTTVFAFMQDAYKMMEQLTNIVGSKYILSGCEESGEYVSPGFVSIDGEIMPFEGGNAAVDGGHVYVDSTSDPVTVGDGSYTPTTKLLRVGYASGSFSYEHLVRFTNLVDIKSLLSTHNHDHLVSVEVKKDKDLNVYTQPGLYKCPLNVTAQTLSNCPTSNAFSLLVETHAGTKQTLTEYVTVNPKAWFRNKYDTTWGPWYRIFTESDPHTHTHAHTTTDVSGLEGRLGPLEAAKHTSHAISDVTNLDTQLTDLQNDINTRIKIIKRGSYGPERFYTGSISTHSKTITFDKLETANYLVVGTIRLADVTSDGHNDRLSFVVHSLTDESFKVYTSNHNNETNNLYFDYILISLD